MDSPPATSSPEPDSDRIIKIHVPRHPADSGAVLKVVDQAVADALALNVGCGGDPQDECGIGVRFDRGDDHPDDALAAACDDRHVVRMPFRHVESHRHLSFDVKGLSTLGGRERDPKQGLQAWAIGGDLSLRKLPR